MHLMYLTFNCFFPACRLASAYPPSASRLQRFCYDLVSSTASVQNEPLSLLTVRAGPRAIGMVSARANVESGPGMSGRNAENLKGSEPTGGEEYVHQLRQRRVGKKVRNVVILEEAAAMAELADAVNRRNGVADICTVFQRVDLGEELKNMARNHLRYDRWQHLRQCS